MAAGKDNLTKFLLDLSTDPDRVERLADNAEAEAARAHLSNEERVAVFSGDAAQIRIRLQANDNGTGIMTRAPVKKKPGKGIMKKKKRPSPKKKKKGSRKRGAKKA